MVVTADERLRLLHQVDQLEGAIAEGCQLVQEIAEAMASGLYSEAQALKARAERLYRYATEE